MKRTENGLEVLSVKDLATGADVTDDVAGDVMNAVAGDDVSAGADAS